MSLTIGTDRWAVVAALDPDAYAAGAHYTDAIDFSDYDQLMFVVMSGTMSGGTIDFKVEQATTSGGTYKDVTNASITQISVPSPVDNNAQQVINLDPTAIDMNNDYRYVRGALTLGSSSPEGNTDASVLVIGRAKKKPASDVDLASVSEIVSV